MDVTHSHGLREVTCLHLNFLRFFQHIYVQDRSPPVVWFGVPEKKACWKTLENSELWPVVRFYFAFLEDSYDLELGPKLAKVFPVVCFSDAFWTEHCSGMPAYWSHMSHSSSVNVSSGCCSEWAAEIAAFEEVDRGLSLILVTDWVTVSWLVSLGG